MLKLISKANQKTLSPLFTIYQVERGFFVQCHTSQSPKGDSSPYKESQASAPFYSANQKTLSPLFTIYQVERGFFVQCHTSQSPKGDSSPYKESQASAPFYSKKTTFSPLYHISGREGIFCAVPHLSVT